jgi:hypothetical protein
MPPTRDGGGGGGGAGGGQGAQVNQGGASAPAFALTPATTDLIGLIDYSNKLGQPIYKQGCNKLTNDEGFAMSPSITAAFVKTFENCCTIMGWNRGAQNVTKFTNQSGVVINIVKNHGCIDKPTLKIACKPFCHPGRLHAQACVAQNNHMMVQCLKKSPTMASLARLEPYQSQYTFNNVKYSLLMYKIIMR